MKRDSETPGNEIKYDIIISDAEKPAAFAEHRELDAEMLDEYSDDELDDDEGDLSPIWKISIAPTSKAELQSIIGHLRRERRPTRIQYLTGF